MENRNWFKQLIAKCKNKPEKIEKYGLYLTKWAKDYLKQTTGFGYVVGLSGGIDSSLALAILAQNKDLKLVGAFIDIESSKQDLEDAKLLIGLYEPLEGIVELDSKTTISYYAQEHEIIDANKTILENFSDSGMTDYEIRRFMGSFLFTGDDIYKVVKNLSPG